MRAEPSPSPLPIAFSIPFSKGQVADLSNIKILSNGKDIPAQFRVLNPWDDGSFKWVQAIAPPSDTYQISYNQGPSSAVVPHPVHASRDPTTAALTGADTALNIDLNTCIATFAHNGQTLAFALSRLADQNQTVFHARGGTAKIIENGPLRATLRIRADHRDDAGRSYLKFDVFLSLCADIPILEITHVLGIDNGEDAEFLSLASLDIPIELNQNIANASILIDGSPCSIPTPGRLFQSEDHRFDIIDDLANIQTTGARAEGIISVATPTDGMFVAIPEFWQQYPKGFAVRETGLDIELFPKLDILGAGCYANRENEHIWYYYLRDDRYTLRQGVEKSHRLFIGFNGPDWDDQTLAALPHQPIVLPDFDRLLETGVVGLLVPPGDVFADWDNRFQKAFEQYQDKLREERWYGLLNWGDWHGERIHNWGNLEYDDPACFFLQALRFGEPKYFHQAVRGARHYIDIDTISRHANPDNVGRVWAHSLGHTGGYFATGSFKINNYDMSDNIFHTGRSSPGHTRCEGLAWQYLLTGDVRTLEHIRKIGDHLTKNPMVAGTPWKGTAREPGWAMVALTAAYDATGDCKYLDAAEKIADVVLAQANGKGVWHRPLESRNCMYLKYPDHPRCHGELSFPIAFQAAGMISVYERTGRADIRENIIASAHYVMTHIYNPKQRGFIHSPCPLREQSTKVGGITGTNMWYPLAFAYHETGNRDILQAILDSWEKTDRENAWFDEYPVGPPQRFTGAIIFMPKIQALLQTAFQARR